VVLLLVLAAGGEGPGLPWCQPRAAAAASSFEDFDLGAAVCVCLCMQIESERWASPTLGLQ